MTSASELYSMFLVKLIQKDKGNALREAQSKYTPNTRTRFWQWTEIQNKNTRSVCSLFPTKDDQANLYIMSYTTHTGTVWFLLPFVRKWSELLAIYTHTSDRQGDYDWELLPVIIEVPYGVVAECWPKQRVQLGQNSNQPAKQWASMKSKQIHHLLNNRLFKITSILCGVTFAQNRHTS